MITIMMLIARGNSLNIYYVLGTVKHYLQLPVSIYSSLFLLHQWESEAQGTKGISLITRLGRNVI